MAYYFVVGNCFTCGSTMAYNPQIVPSIVNPNTDEKEAVCANCISLANKIRAKDGTPPLTYNPDAFEPADEEEYPL